MGYRIITSRASDDESRWRGYLANVTPAEWERDFRRVVPERLTGAEFLRTYGNYSDPVTTVDPARSYVVRQPAAHPIYEHDRVRRYRDLLLGTPITEHVLEALGELRYQSHLSYSARGLGSDGTDTLVEMVRREGQAAGCMARRSPAAAAAASGGAGGARRAALTRRRTLHARHRRPSAVIAGSSDSADQK